MRVVAIINQKGGCGKTTTAINLAGVLARLGRRALLIDMDPQSHCAVGLGIPENRFDQHIGDAMLAPDAKRLDESRLLWRVRRGLDLIPSAMRLAGLEAAQGGLFGRQDRDLRLKSVIDRFQDRADWVLIDCPPSIGLLTFNALRAATEVLIPVEMSYFALRGAERQARTILSLARRMGGRTPFRMLPTMHRPGDTLAEELLAELRAKFPDHVIPHSIRRDEKLREAAGFGQPLVEYDAAAPGAMDYADLAVWLIANPPLRLRGRAASSARKMAPAVEAGAGRQALESRGDDDAPDSDTLTDVEPTGGGMDDDLDGEGGVAADVGVRAMLASIAPGPAQGADGAAEGAPRPAPVRAPAPRPLHPEPRACSALTRREHSPEFFRVALVSAGSAVLASRGFPGATAVAGAPPEEFTAPPLTTLSRAAELAAKARRLLAESVSLQARLAADPDVARLAAAEARAEGAPLRSLEDKLRRISGVRESSRGVLFIHPAGRSSRVFVAGDFNGWSATATPLRYNERLGVHEACIALPAGRRQYRLIVDGRWITDPHNECVAADVFGEVNSVVTIRRVEHERACEGAD